MIKIKVRQWRLLYSESYYLSYNFCFQNLIKNLVLPKIGIPIPGGYEFKIPILISSKTFQVPTLYLIMNLLILISPFSLSFSPSHQEEQKRWTYAPYLVQDSQLITDNTH
jgi:hypothetical protein